MKDHLTAIVVLGGLVPALLPACGGDGADGGAATDTVRVAVQGLRIEIPDTLPARATTFRITNRDTLAHSFRVEEVVQENLPPNLAPDRIVEELESSVAPGETGTVTVDLRPGDFEVSCPLADHARRGMRADVTVAVGAP